MSYNSVAFSPEDVEKGYHQDLLDYLTDFNKKSDDDYYEIHITSDGYCMIIEFEKVPYSREFGGRFEYVDEDQCIMTEKQLPDDTYVLVHDEDEYKELLDDFLKENPNYEKNEFGRWINTDALHSISTKVEE